MTLSVYITHLSVGCCPIALVRGLGVWAEGNVAGLEPPAEPRNVRLLSPKYCMNLRPPPAIFPLWPEPSSREPVGARRRSTDTCGRCLTTSMIPEMRQSSCRSKDMDFTRFHLLAQNYFNRL